ncbi:MULTISPECIES: GNAT family N-acetyltransferase [Aminobacterium]|jgi:ribosomal protein S18 acetylase RimI-like enzyme|uniref:GCN5-related N-acetyltransferase n=1 Tax=Aminobacterium colombiense (strain DSM 12261 / ALA-1) TaxID=572547 RepID=D5EE20_AMICL|nr:MULTISPECIES: GNAT family N-acetyltransferase [Aminobacterium]MDD2378656.1 GNAT family N-acetyltransferase [Aminobacterium colombiense]ADE56802.1 GCN5-related N-acetyltransferase [Aminobacterium colombiense DSM 12261]MDD3767674.1 GNAT family N-acetyltransferase [Aminobacterium colombiense]MDD4264958.1 GNAT family N-acetyltransferase [Aminobacterium colombiense]MDD4585479.1 GNAT family N-acetyltransferase [Aminobacterium colombiense]
MKTKLDYAFYDSKKAVTSSELRELYRFTLWGKSRSLEDIERMLEGTTMCFSVRHEEKLIAFCRILTDFIFRGSLWDIMVHPDFQGKGIGSALINYALTHPAIRAIPLIITYTSELEPFLTQYGFERKEGALMLLRRPIEYS